MLRKHTENAQQRHRKRIAISRQMRGKRIAIAGWQTHGKACQRVANAWRKHSETHAEARIMCGKRTGESMPNAWHMHVKRTANAWQMYWTRLDYSLQIHSKRLGNAQQTHGKAPMANTRQDTHNTRRTHSKHDANRRRTQCRRVTNPSQPHDKRTADV